MKTDEEEKSACQLEPNLFEALRDSLEKRPLISEYHFLSLPRIEVSFVSALSTLWCNLSL